MGPENLAAVGDTEAVPDLVQLAPVEDRWEPVVPALPLAEGRAERDADHTPLSYRGELR